MLEFTELRETFMLLVYYIRKDMIKDIDEQPDGEIRRARSGRVPSAVALCPWSWGATPS